MDKTVKTTLVARRLKVTNAVLTRLHQEGYLVRAERGRYNVEDVDHFLRQNSINFGGQPLTWERLRTGAVILLRHEDLGEVSYGRLYLMRRQLPHVKFPGTNGGSRYDQESVKSLFADEPIVGVDRAVKLLGFLNSSGVKALMKKGELQRAYDPWHRKTIYVTEGSLRTVLLQRLPPWVNVDDWINDCDSTDEPLVAPRLAAQSLGVQPSKFGRLLRERRASYISAGGIRKGIKVSPIWLAAQLENARPYRGQDVAALFDVNLATVYEWKRSGHVRCPVPGHAHSDNQPYLVEACWVAIIRATSPGYQRSALLFVRSRQVSNPTKLLDAGEVASMFRLPVKEVERMAETGGLPGVRTPLGKWRFVKQRMHEVYHRDWQ